MHSRASDSDTDDDVFRLDEDIGALSLGSDAPRTEERPVEEVEEDRLFEIHDYVAPLNNATEMAKTSFGPGDFEPLSVLGRGAYGKVYLVKRRSGEAGLYAMKVLKKATIVLHGKKDFEHTQSERAILEAVQHPFIVQLHYAFQTPLKLYLILSYASGGELFSYLAKERMFPEESAAFYSAEILLTLEHLHGLGIIYRDLKPENVLLSADGHVLLTDFGLSKVALEATTVCGTPEFTAPEILSNATYDRTVDYWSLGIMTYDMLTGAPPFTGHNRKKIMESILRKKPVFPRFMTSFAKDFCTKLLKKNPTQRLGSSGVSAIKEHSFFRKMDFKKLLAREIPPPFIPTLNHEEDTSHFSVEFTGMALESPPAHGPGDGQMHAFDGFSYVAQSGFSSHQGNMGK